MGKREKKKPSTQTDLNPGPFTQCSFARPLEPLPLPKQIKIQQPRNRTLITSCRRSKSGQTENVSDGLNFDRKSKTDETKKASATAADGTSEGATTCTRPTRFHSGQKGLEEVASPGCLSSWSLHADARVLGCSGLII